MKGKLGALTALSIGASAYPELRVSVGGFEAHMVLFFVFISIPIAITVIQNKKLQAMLIAAAVFYLLFFLSLLPGQRQIVSNAVKLGAFLLTVVVSIGFVETQKDYQNIVIATCLAGVAICARGLIGFDSVTHGVNPLEGISNKNAFSVFLLPPMLLGAYELVWRKSGFIRNLIISSSFLVMAVTIFSSGNRSGWLGVVMIAALYMYWSKMKVTRIITVTVGAMLVYYFIGETGARDAVVMQKIEQTTGGYHSDDLRFEIFKACLQVALANPILGASPGRLGIEMAKYLPAWTEGHLYGAHNLLAHLLGACGLFVTGIFFYWLFTIVQLSRRDHNSGASLGLALVVLFLVRGMFTEEVMYNPMFGACFGIVIGQSLRSYNIPQYIKDRQDWIPAILRRDGRLEILP